MLVHAIPRIRAITGFPLAFEGYTLECSYFAKYANYTRRTRRRSRTATTSFVFQLIRFLFLPNCSSDRTNRALPGRRLLNHVALARTAKTVKYPRLRQSNNTPQVKFKPTDTEPTGAARGYRSRLSRGTDKHISRGSIKLPRCLNIAKSQTMTLD